MFDIGFSELVVIALVALIVLGPQRLPEVARTAGRWAATARRFMNTVKADFEREMTAPELEQFRKLQQEIAETRTLIEAPAETLLDQPRPSDAAPGQSATAPALVAPAAPATAPTAPEKRKRKPKAPKPAATAAAAPAEQPAAEQAAQPPTQPQTQEQPAAVKPKAARKKHGGTQKRTAG